LENNADAFRGIREKPLPGDLRCERPRVVLMVTSDFVWSSD
jgi:hypothetical protein